MRAFTRAQAVRFTHILIAALACAVPCAAAHGKAPERAVTGSAAAAALVQELVAQTMERYRGGK